MCMCVCISVSEANIIINRHNLYNKASLSSVNKCKQPARTRKMSPRRYISRTATPQNPMNWS